MIYIVSTLKAEAFIDVYKLKKTRVGNYFLFSNDLFVLIMSDEGVANTRIATQTLINLFDISDDDIYIHIGVCKAPAEYEKNALMEIDAISYEDKLYILKAQPKHILTCLDEEANEEKTTLVDRESFGFYDAVMHSPAIKNFFVFKVISDCSEAQEMSEDATKILVSNVLEEIEKIVHERS